VTKRSRQFRRIRKTSRRLKQPLLNLLPDLVKMRDSGRISPAECAAWSYVIGASGLAKKLRRDIVERDSYVIRRTRTRWQLFHLKAQATKGLSPPRTSELQKHNSGRALLILTDPMDGTFHFDVLGPPRTMPTTQPGTGTTTPDDAIRHIVQCKTCGWRADSVKHVERAQEKHKARCKFPELFAVPYTPIRITIPGPILLGHGSIGATPKRRRVGNAIRGRELKGMPVDVPLHHRTGLNVPNVYPDDN
jgi:hypothetical protein